MKNYVWYNAKDDYLYLSLYSTQFVYDAISTYLFYIGEL